MSIEERTIGTEPLDAILAAVADVQREQSKDSPGFTMREYADAAGLGRCTAGEHLRTLHRAGRLRCVGVKPVATICGYKKPTPCYELVVTSAPPVARPSRAPRKAG